MNKRFQEAEIKSMLGMVTKEMISFSRFVELINDRIPDKTTSWHKTEQGDLPVCYETGYSSGKRSDLVLVKLKNGEKGVARFYLSITPSTPFGVWVDTDNNDISKSVIEWCEIPE